jgi:hypothetical protein
LKFFGKKAKTFAKEELSVWVTLRDGATSSLHRWQYPKIDRYAMQRIAQLPHPLPELLPESRPLGYLPSVTRTSNAMMMLWVTHFILDGPQFPFETLSGDLSNLISTNVTTINRS